MDNEKLILERFHSLKSKSEFAHLLNNLDRISLDIKPTTLNITPSYLNRLAFSKNFHYQSYKIPKKNGKSRKIDAPQYYLKLIQKRINYILQIIFNKKVHHSTNGFLKNRNIVRNAKPHINKKYVLRACLNFEYC